MLAMSRLLLKEWKRKRECNRRRRARGKRAGGEMISHGEAGRGKWARGGTETGEEPATTWSAVTALVVFIKNAI